MTKAKKRKSRLVRLGASWPTNPGPLLAIEGFGEVVSLAWMAPERPWDAVSLNQDGLKELIAALQEHVV
jgi:hypothetical protein